MVKGVAALMKTIWLILLCLFIGGLFILLFWDIPAPSAPVQKNISYTRIGPSIHE